MNIIDARGLECPTPVIKTKDFIESGSGGDFKVLVDNIASKENILRFLKSKGLSAEVVESGDQFEIIVNSNISSDSISSSKLKSKNIVNNVIYISDDKVGSDEKLGKLLMKSFIHTIKEADQLPSRIIFVNRGVYLTTESKDSIEDLKNLSDLGVEIYSCGTCLNYFNLTEKLKVGVIGNAYDTVNFLSIADSVIKF
ncbi:MAG: sulfurtransferase-like selenium metabolism protein YedF [Candidatus Delongbacteria bacterium]|nr:MAG: sulfurtransferase-like selenium metabolism protein YedF [Candidatus Delongbacteria bacterium]